MIFIIAFLGAITPGPDIILVLRMALKEGFLSAIKTLAGIATGWVIFLSILYFGFAHILKGDFIQALLGFGGGIYLFYLAFLLFKAKPNNLNFEAKNEESNILDSDNKPFFHIINTNHYLKGLFINLSNPKAIIFFSVIIAPYIDNNLFFNLILLFCGLSSAFLCVIFLALFFRKLITNQLFDVIDKLCAFIFFAFGVGLFMMAIRQFL